MTDHPPAPLVTRDQMTFVGLDLAWGWKNNTGLCAVRDGQVVASALKKSDDDIVDWLQPYCDGSVLIAVDAPLIVANATGRRVCESIVSSWMGKYEAGAHSSNTGRPGFANGPRGAGLASRLGIGLDPALEPGKPTRRAIEVYPHPALVALFELPKTIKYKAKKGRSREDRRVEFGRLTDCLEQLAQADPPLDVQCDRWRKLKAAIDTALTGAALDRIEDELDAYVCAYIGLHYWTHGRPKSRVIGTLGEGYIVTPMATADGDVRDDLVAQLDTVEEAV